MNPYPGKNSVIILDNAKIHHDENLIEILEELGCHIIFLSPYSFDFNPIKTAVKINEDFINTFEKLKELIQDLKKNFPKTNEIFG